MQFNSFDYLFFLPLVAIFYYLFPQKMKKAWLLMVSYVFLALWDIKYLIILLTVTIFTYFVGLALDSISVSRVRKLIIFLTILGCVGVLVVYKYVDFLIANINKLLSGIGINNIGMLELMLPVGISFYTLQALGYVIDVYRGKYEAEKNLLVYSLFVGFFPQMVSGPIGRGDKMLPQYKSKITFDIYKIEDGLISFAYGLFLKIVVADNISIVSSPIISDYANHNGMEILLAFLLYSIQIYCDFYGYSLMAIGSGRILQIELMENFCQPYMAKSVRTFWREWHISLTSWFTDYVYIPLGGSRKGKVRKWINTMVVFLVSGLWHGAAWHYIVWGGINGFYLIVEDILIKPAIGLLDIIGVERNCRAWKVLKRLILFVVMTSAWAFFCTSSLKATLASYEIIVQQFRPVWFLSEECFEVFITSRRVGILLLSFLTIFSVDYYKYKGIDFKKLIFKQQLVYRWMIYILLLLIIVAWGAYGEGYEQTQFIYFEF